MYFFESELKVMKVLWKNENISASNISKILEQEEGWKKSTTYTMLGKCIDKGYIERIDPGFMCRPIIGKEQASIGSISEQIDKSYNSRKDFFHAFLNKENLTKDEIDELFKIVEQLK